MKYSMYRQPRTAAILYASTVEELHTAMKKQRKQRLHTILTIVLAILSATVTVTLILLMKKDWEAQEQMHDADAVYDAFRSEATVGTLPSGGSYDPLCPDAVTMTDSLADKVLRLHILANSDSTDDQAVKLVVRDAVLAYLSDSLLTCADKEEAKDVLSTQLESICDVANAALSKQGYRYRAEARLTTAQFPLKVYGDIFLPAGTYETLQITLGEASGQNWWCLLFPSLCLVDSFSVIETPEEPKTATEGTPTVGATIGAEQPEAATPGVAAASLLSDASHDSVATSPVSEMTAGISSSSLRDALEQREYEAIPVDKERITFRLSFLVLFRFLD